MIYPKHLKQELSNSFQKVKNASSFAHELKLRFCFLKVRNILLNFQSNDHFTQLKSLVVSKVECILHVAGPTKVLWGWKCNFYLFIHFVCLFIFLTRRKATEALIHRARNYPDLLSQMPRHYGLVDI